MDNDIHTPYVEISNEGKAKLMCARCDYLCTKVEHCKRLPLGAPPMTLAEKVNRQVSLNPSTWEILGFRTGFYPP
eukprot:5307946-Prymnesium_polylepis.1